MLVISSKNMRDPQQFLDFTTNRIRDGRRTAGAAKTRQSDVAEEIYLP